MKSYDAMVVLVSLTEDDATWLQAYVRIKLQDGGEAAFPGPDGAKVRAMLARTVEALQKARSNAMHAERQVRRENGESE